MRAQCTLGVAKKVLPNLGLSELLHVSLVSVNATAGLIELDNVDCFAAASFLPIESSKHVTIETLRAKHYYYVDYRTVSRFAEAKKMN